MKVTITYCPPCGLREPAEKIAESLERELSLGAALREGFWGAFKIEWGGEVIFNRWTDRGFLGRIGFGRIPTPEEIVTLVRRKSAENSPEESIPIA
jgi:hypothetical protein